LNAFQEFIESTRLVVGITQMDNNATPTIDDYVRQMKDLDIHAPVFEVDARRRDDVSSLIQALLLSIDPVL
jgi:signal recognition particle receptor subunit beta